MTINVGRGVEIGLTGFRHSNLFIFGTMLVSAIISLVSALVLSIDAWLLAANPSTGLSCDINSIISCGTVAKSWQAEILGFPNSFIGLMCEPVVVTIAVAGMTGVKFPRWFMFTAQLVYLCGLTFAYWLFSQSILDIGALCPWCLAITFGTTGVFFTLLHYNIREDNLYLPPRAQVFAEKFTRVGGDALVSIIFIVVIALIIVFKYGRLLLV